MARGRGLQCHRERQVSPGGWQTTLGEAQLAPHGHFRAAPPRTSARAPWLRIRTMLGAGAVNAPRWGLQQ